MPVYLKLIEWKSSVCCEHILYVLNAFVSESILHMTVSEA